MQCQHKILSRENDICYISKERPNNRQFVSNAFVEKIAQQDNLKMNEVTQTK